ncbi:low temperature requirement protein A [Micromonospora costi]|uniref:low temperature requirement protein A n=1 Tax=Micromonospora costi TaxID=1530042 RepID=UPI0033F8A893
MARDVYTYLHLPLVAGIILFALGLKGVLSEGSDPATRGWGVPLPGFDLLALYGGVALYGAARAGPDPVVVDRRRRDAARARADRR